MDKHRVVWAICLVVLGMTLEATLLLVYKEASKNELVLYDSCYELYRDAVYCQVRTRLAE